MSEAPRREYQQTRRAEAAEATGERILDAAARLIAERWMDDFSLAEIAKGAEVTVQTVIRRFGSKEQLLAAMSERLGAGMKRTAADAVPDDLEDAIGRLMDDYERTGDMLWRCLAQEDRHPFLTPWLDIGRGHYRAWVERTFPTALARRTPAQRAALVDGLVAAMDVLTWKLLRRDLQRSHAQTAVLIAATVRALLDADLHPHPRSGAPRR